MCAIEKEGQPSRRTLSYLTQVLLVIITRTFTLYCFHVLTMLMTVSIYYIIISICYFKYYCTILTIFSNTGLIMCQYCT